MEGVDHARDHDEDAVVERKVQDRPDESALLAEVVARPKVIEIVEPDHEEDDDTAKGGQVGHAVGPGEAVDGQVDGADQADEAFAAESGASAKTSG